MVAPYTKFVIWASRIDPETARALAYDRSFRRHGLGLCHAAIGKDGPALELRRASVGIGMQDAWLSNVLLFT